MISAPRTHRHQTTLETLTDTSGASDTATHEVQACTVHASLGEKVSVLYCYTPIACRIDGNVVGGADLKKTLGKSKPAFFTSD